jgi:hypothetical protein
VRVALRRIDDHAGGSALTRFVDQPDQLLADGDALALAVRYGLQLLRDKAPGASVEVRIPPFGAAQAIEGPTHTRGTPPAVIEMSAEVWLGLVTGKESYDDAVDSGTVVASGLRTDLQGFLPLWPLG